MPEDYILSGNKARCLGKEKFQILKWKNLFVPQANRKRAQKKQQAVKNE